MKSRHREGLRPTCQIILSAIALAVTSALVLAAQAGGTETPLPPAAPPGILLPADGSAPVTGEILVKFRSLADADEVERRGGVAAARRPGLAAVLERHEIRGGRRPFARVSHRRLDRIVKVVSERARRDPRRLQEVLAALKARPEVEYAEPNVTLHALGVPNDPYFTSSGAWGQAFGDLWGLHKMALPPAWDHSQGEFIAVAVLDTGIDYTHPELNVWKNGGELGFDGLGRDRRTNGVDDEGNGFVDDWRGWDFTAPGVGSNDPTDLHGHGTHVAGTIAALGNNAVGVVGVAPLAKVMAVRVLDAGGFGTVEQISSGILYAANAGARVINASLGAEGDTPQTLVDAIAYAHDVKGVVFVAAAGNSNLNVGPPGRGSSPPTSGT